MQIVSYKASIVNEEFIFYLFQSDNFVSYLFYTLVNFFSGISSPPGKFADVLPWDPQFMFVTEWSTKVSCFLHHGRRGGKNSERLDVLLWVNKSKWQGEKSPNILSFFWENFSWICGFFYCILDTFLNLHFLHFQGTFAAILVLLNLGNARVFCAYPILNYVAL